jgi:hypothetical protein
LNVLNSRFPAGLCFLSAASVKMRYPPSGQLGCLFYIVIVLNGNSFRGIRSVLKRFKGFSVKKRCFSQENAVCEKHAVRLKAIPFGSSARRD